VHFPVTPSMTVLGKEVNTDHLFVVWKTWRESFFVVGYNASTLCTQNDTRANKIHATKKSKWRRVGGDKVCPQQWFLLFVFVVLPLKDVCCCCCRSHH